MDNATSGKRKQRTESSPTQGTTRKKLRDNGADGQAAVTTSVPANTGKKRRVHLEDAVPQGVGPETDAEASACAVRLVATAEGVAATEVEHDHRVLEARSERPVHAGVAVAVGTAPRPLGPGCAPQQMVVPIHPALPFGEERQRRTSRRWRCE